MTPSGQSMNHLVYMKSVGQRRIAIVDMYRAEENALICATLVKIVVCNARAAQSLFCEAHTYQNKMATIRSNNMKPDEMKVLFNCSTALDGKDKRLKP